MRLSENDISRASFHLGLSSGTMTPAGDVARFYEAVNRIQDSYWYSQVTNHLDRCDRAYAASEVLKEVATEGSIAPSRLQTIFGDANRSISISDPLNADTQYWEIYLREVDRLAETLYVSNYRRPDVRRYAFDRSGSEFIMAIPGPADTAVETRVALRNGSLGWR